MFMPGVWILWSKKNVIIFQKENGNTFTLLIIFIVKSLIYCYDPQSAGINLQSPQSDSTPWTLTLGWWEKQIEHSNFKRNGHKYGWKRALMTLFAKSRTPIKAKKVCVRGAMGPKPLWNLELLYTYYDFTRYWIVF